VVLTWSADPLFNLLLRLNRFGRLCLSGEQIVAANWVGGCVLLALLSLGAWLATGDELWLWTAAGCGIMVLPVSGIFHCQAGWPRGLMAGCTGIIAYVGLAALGLYCLGTEVPWWKIPVALFIAGLVLSSWVGNVLAMFVPRK